MTCVIHIGRRLPRAWFKRTAERVKGLMSFQENIWQIVKQSMVIAKRKANDSGKLKFVMTVDFEQEDINYQIEWIKIMIQGNEEQEKEEYEEAMQMYKPLGKIFKKDMPVDENMRRHIKSKVLSSVKIEEAYKKGYGSVDEEGSNMANKLLEMGIITHIELIKDYDLRNTSFNAK